MGQWVIMPSSIWTYTWNAFFPPFLKSRFQLVEFRDLLHIILLVLKIVLILIMWGGGVQMSLEARRECLILQGLTWVLGTEPLRSSARAV